jgi:Photoprotection regulator fluorescence recovery protein
MTSLPSRVPAGAGTAMQDLKWSATEKVIARKAFNLALERELQTVVLEAKSMAAKIQKPSDLWDLEQYLTQRRREIDRIYDYRYSVPPARSCEAPQQRPPRRGRAARSRRRQAGLDPALQLYMSLEQ